MRGMALKKPASYLMLRSISAKALKFVQQVRESCSTRRPGGIQMHLRCTGPRKLDLMAIQQIRGLWSQDPRNSQQEIARMINFSALSTKYQNQDDADEERSETINPIIS